jgi:alanine racemase
MSAIPMRNSKTSSRSHSPVPPFCSSSAFAPLTWIELDRAAIAHNLRQIRKLIGNRPLMAVVKGNAYGHGAAVLCPELQRLGVDWFGVARVREALELREAGITANIINMGFLAPGDEEAVIKHNIIQALFRADDAVRLSRVAKRQRSSARVHLKIDTGLNRLGVRHDEALAFAKKIAALDGINVEGIFTVLTEEPEFDLEQVRRLNSVIPPISNLKSPHFANNLLRHAASSAALLQDNNKPLLLDMARCGIMLHGLFPSGRARDERKIDLRPTMSFKTRIGLIKQLRKGEGVGYHREFVAPRDMRIAVLPLGYSDGIDPRIANGGAVLICGRRFPLVSAITINLSLPELRADSDLREGDEVVLIGKQGKEQITADEMASWTGQSTYQLIVRLSPYIERVLV